MSRTYSGIRPKLDRVYSAEQVLALYNISRNTLGNWITSGLHPSDSGQPRIFRGAELDRFHAARRGTKQPLALGQFKCMGCKARVIPEVRSLRFMDAKGRAGLAFATCPDCGSGISKILNETARDTFKKCLETNTSLSALDEGNADTPARIVQDQGGEPLQPVSPNDRLLFDWQNWAARHDKKTVAAHLRAIRQFEQFNGLTPFAETTPQDAARWREAVIAGKWFDGQDRSLSRSTIQHQASHLRAFFDWLGKRPGHRKLAEVSDYLELPRRFTQSGLTKHKAYPEIEEAEALLVAMPRATLKDRRARAIYACAYVCGLRASALVTLRLRHVDTKRRVIHHDGTELRAKNGKSFVVNWFPRTEAFQAVLLEWLDELQQLGLGPEDALFPELADLKLAAQPERNPFAPMESARTVTEAFAIACRKTIETYSPHSVRHTLAQLGDRICRNSEERKAWSLNLGHSTELITWTYYGKVGDERRGEPRRVCRRLQLLSRMEHHEQDDEQVFP